MTQAQGKESDSRLAGFHVTKCLVLSLTSSYLNFRDVPNDPPVLFEGCWYAGSRAAEVEAARSKGDQPREIEEQEEKKEETGALLGCWFPHSECRVVLVRLRLPPAAADSHTPYIISYNPHHLSHREVTNPLMYQVFSPANYHRRQCSSALIAYGKWAYSVRW
ncbi:hypothetical protein E2C01_039381 [Portunus trituberculatus]|uniref:Uncharacterized protein n=1 Tax=Portunus trituberculatus TaxID=210409 RepID=A0A5B7FJQ3_PORTR|nr:hypothetical protein [Portunus trituberculatus]